MASLLPGLAGAAAIVALLEALGISLPSLAEAIASNDPEKLASALTNIGPQVPGLGKLTIGDVLQGKELDAEAIGAAAFNLFVDETLNVRAGATEADAQQAIKTLEKVLGFAITLPVTFGAIGGILKLVFAGRGAAFEDSAIAHLPEELGLNFFLGTILSALFERAVGTPLEEAVNVTHRPNRIDDTTVRRLLQQHKLNEADANELLIKLGYPDNLIPLVKQLDQTFLTVAELQELYLFGLIQEDVVTDHLQRVGYNDDDINVLRLLIIQKAQTQGGDYLRSVARSEVVSNHITLDQFAVLLREANVPQPSIELEVQAVKLLQDSGKASLSVAQLKSAFQAGILSQDTVQLDLQQRGYAVDDATTLIATWIDEGTNRQTKIGENRILSYYLSGVLTQQQALALLVGQGVKASDAAFLIAHPSITGSAYRYDLTPGTVLSALTEGVITVDEAVFLLARFNIAPEEAKLEVQVAVAKQVRRKKPGGAVKHITVAEIEQSFKLGLIAPSAIHSRLVELGYSSDDADLLYAIWFTQTSANGAPPPGWVQLT